MPFRIFKLDRAYSRWLLAKASNASRPWIGSTTSSKRGKELNTRASGKSKPGIVLPDCVFA
jgi:hypothetical protein